MGFTKTLIKEGNGVKPQRGQNVTVHCTGYGKNRDMNLKFWSTKDPGQEPFTFRVGMGEVIKGVRIQSSRFCFGWFMSNEDPPH